MSRAFAPPRSDIKCERIQFSSPQIRLISLAVPGSPHILWKRGVARVTARRVRVDNHSHMGERIRCGWHRQAPDVGRAILPSWESRAYEPLSFR
jgi:hypothetical protein